MSRKLSQPLAALVAVLLLTGCAAQRTPPSEAFKAWVGQPVDRIKVCWGAPDRETMLSDGKRVMTWIKTTSQVAAGASVTVSCTANVVTAGGRVTEVRYIGGCEDVLYQFPTPCP